MKILIIGASWVGDMVMAQSLFKMLKQHSPSCQIDVLAPDWSRAILERMPEVKKAISMPLGHGTLDLKARVQLGKSLRKEKYDQAILLPNSLKSAITPFFARIPKRTGWRGEMRYGLLNDLRVLDKKKYPLMVERFVALALQKGEKISETVPYPLLKIEPESRERALNKLGLKKGQRKILALCPGAEFGPAKKWPAKNYASLAAKKIGSGWSIWIFGSEKDRADAEQIRLSLSKEQKENCFILAGKTALAEAVDLMSLADAVVSNDSGLMHIAAALSRPLVVVYGSTSPEFTPPLSDQVSTITSKLNCAPCFERECPLGHLDCLNKLDSDRVSMMLDDLVGER